MRTTKIVATLGPATDASGVLAKLFRAGVDVFRLNASHGTHEDHARRIEDVRRVAGELGMLAGVLLDLQGPKIRLGRFEGGVAELETGATFAITTDAITGTAERASTNYNEFVAEVKPGDRVLLADGAVELTVLRKTATDVIFGVVSGGRIGDRKGINLPGVELSTPSLTGKDIADLRFGLAAGIDFIALSFVRRREDVLRLRAHLEEAQARVPVVAKIEKPAALANLEAILEESDGVMVARGDLGVEIPVEKVPFVQKSIIERARRHGKFVITATQMLESMIENPYPTRAEVSDVANAIWDGTDAVMLSGETSAGAHPVEAARMMAQIAVEADTSIREQGYKEPPKRDRPTDADIIADSAYHAARLMDAKAIVVFTATGYSARLVSRYRPPVPIYAFTPNPPVIRQLQLSYGVEPVLVDDLRHTDDMLARMDRVLLERGWLARGDGVVFVAGQPMGRAGTTNLLKLHRVGT
ncbi:MAG: pyruvate kinase [Acidobacteria bacterium]|nr:pyruvate kinase [Acidobacteriota bacterium]MBI3281772.1 pyruvate kinase [Acidobacteriota bacterium]